MDEFVKKEVVQAILIADDNANNFRPITDHEHLALLPLVNVPMIEYALEILNRNDVEEVFIISSKDPRTLKDYIRQSKISFSSWTNNMKIHVFGGEGIRCFGDAMRDLDSKGVIREHFILLSANTITNANIKSLLEQHRRTFKYDKGAVSTFVFKERETQCRTNNEIMIAMDAQNKRLYYHYRLNVNKREAEFEIPLEIFMNNAEVALLHNIVDSGLIIGSPAMLSLFSDNFDFETCDDFIRGVLINEEILDSRFYVELLPLEQYAYKVINWPSYQIVSYDIINRWVYPLVPDMGISNLQQQYNLLKNNIYRSSKANLFKVTLHENVVVHKNTSVGQGTYLANAVIGENCTIGENCHLNNAIILDNVTIGDNCKLEYCFVGSGNKIDNNCEILKGTVIDYNCEIPDATKLNDVLITSTISKYDAENVQKLGEKAFIMRSGTSKSKSNSTNNEGDAEEDDDKEISVMLPINFKICEEESDYNTSSEEESESRVCSPVQDDATIFLSEVIDSLARGLQEKSNPDFLILEINSSRHAYNISLKEVNFNVVKAIFSLKPVKEPTSNVLLDISAVLKQLGPVMKNYIKTKDSMMDCLKALEDIYEENEHVQSKFSNIIHYLYDKDFITENVILQWYHQHLNQSHQTKMRENLLKLIEWLEQSSDEEEDD